MRPGVVWFGEMLPQVEWASALTAAADCDFLLSVGTSGVVYPAAELPLRALGKSATVVHVSPVPFVISGEEFFMCGPASEQLTTLLASSLGLDGLMAE